MANNDTIVDLYKPVFTSNFEHAMQQKQAVLRKTVSEQPISGKQMQVADVLAPTTARTRSGRLQATPNLDIVPQGRWIVPTMTDWGTTIDDFDDMQMLANPQSSYYQNGRAALNRAMDGTIIAALGGNAVTGPAGAGSTALPGGNVIAAGGTGLTLSKIRTVRRLMKTANLEDDEELWFVIGPTQWDNMMSEASFVSVDFNNGKPLVDGRIGYFMGFNFVESTMLELITGTPNVRRCWAYAKSKVRLGIKREIYTDLAKLPTLSFATQLYAAQQIGATRLEEGGVYRVDCAE